MYDDDDEDFEPVRRLIPGHKFQWLNVVIITCNSVGSWIDQFNELLCSHVNYGMQQKQMENDARIEIERMVSGE